MNPGEQFNSFTSVIPSLSSSKSVESSTLSSSSSPITPALELLFDRLLSFTLETVAVLR